MSTSIWIYMVFQISPTRDALGRQHRLHRGFGSTWKHGRPLCPRFLNPNWTQASTSTSRSTKLNQTQPNSTWATTPLDRCSWNLLDTASARRCPGSVGPHPSAPAWSNRSPPWRCRRRHSASAKPQSPVMFLNHFWGDTAGDTVVAMIGIYISQNWDSLESPFGQRPTKLSFGGSESIQFWGLVAASHTVPRKPGSQTLARVKFPECWIDSMP